MLMLRNISITCENGAIKIFWEWNHDEVDGVHIAYKKREIEEGDGTDFFNDIIMRQPPRSSGNAERPIINECGLYTFTFLPRLKSGKTGEKIVLKDIMLGNRIDVFWRAEKQKDGTAILFPDMKLRIPCGITYIQGKDYQFPLEYEIHENTKLIFPRETDIGQISIQFIEPYNKVYRAMKR